MDDATIKKKLRQELTIPELKAILRDNGLSVGGSKAALIDRVVENLAVEFEDPVEPPKKRKKVKKPKLTFTVTRYSPKQYKIAGVKATIKNKSKLMELGANYKPNLKDGPGWLVSEKKYQAVAEWLEDLPYLEYDVIWPEKDVELKMKSLNLGSKPSVKGIDADYLSKVPPDIARKIIFDFDVKDVLNVCSVNKYFADIVCNDLFWKMKIASIKERRYHFTELPHGYNSWKLLYLSLHYYFVEKDLKKVAPGAQIDLLKRVPIYENFPNHGYTIRIALRVGVISSIKMKQGKVNEVEYIDFRTGGVEKLVARGIHTMKDLKGEPRFINSKEYEQQKKKDVRSLVVQGFEINEIPLLFYKNGRMSFYVGQKIQYYPFRHRWYYPDGSSVINGPWYEWEVVGFDENGNAKIIFIESGGMYSERAEEYDYDGKHNEPVKFKKDVLLFDDIKEKHIFKKNKFIESFRVIEEYVLDGEKGSDTLYTPIKEKFTVESNRRYGLNWFE